MNLNKEIKERKNKMKIKNGWLIVKGKFKSEGFYGGDGHPIKFMKLKGIEGEVHGSDWVYDIKKEVLLSVIYGGRKLIKVKE